MSTRCNLALAIAVAAFIPASSAHAQLLKNTLPDIVRQLPGEVLRERTDRVETGQGGPDVPELLQSRWGLTEAHCMQSEFYASGVVIIDDTSIHFDGDRGLFGAPIAKGSNFMRAKVNYLTAEGPSQRDLSIHVRGRRVMQYTEYTDYGPEASEVYVRCRPQPEQQLR